MKRFKIYPMYSTHLREEVNKSYYDELVKNVSDIFDVQRNVEPKIELGITNIAVFKMAIIMLSISVCDIVVRFPGWETDSACVNINSILTNDDNIHILVIDYKDALNTAVLLKRFQIMLEENNK